MQYRRIIKVIILNLALCTSLFFLITNLYKKIEDKEIITYPNYHPLQKINLELGTETNPNLTWQAVFKTNKRLIYSAKIHTDRFGFRVNPYFQSGSKELILTIGDSNTFGLGVNDHETYAALVQKELPWLGVYNLSAPGWGIHQLLRLFELKKELPIIKNKKINFVFYYAISAHIQRVRGKVFWDATYPHYELVNNKLTYTGMRRMIGPDKRSEIQKRLSSDPYAITAEDKEIFALAVEKFKKILKDRYGANLVVIADFNWEPPNENKIESILLKKNIELIEQDKLVGRNRDTCLGKSCFFPLDNHITQAFHQVIANYLVKYISSYKK